MLQIFAWIKTDAGMMIELIKHGKQEFRVPLFTSLCDELSDAFNVNGLDLTQSVLNNA